MLECQDNVANSQVYQLLERLGVKSLRPLDIIQHHILPVLKAQEWQKKPSRLLQAYVIYIKHQVEHDKSLVDLEELKQCAVVLTNHGPCKVAGQPVHFTPAYGGQIDLARMLPGMSRTLCQKNVLDNFWCLLNYVMFCFCFDATQATTGC